MKPKHFVHVGERECIYIPERGKLGLTMKNKLDLVRMRRWELAMKSDGSMRNRRQNAEVNRGGRCQSAMGQGGRDKEEACLGSSRARERERKRER